MLQKKIFYFTLRPILLFVGCALQWPAQGTGTVPIVSAHFHHHHHFICQIIQQYAHLREYDCRRAGQQGPIRTLTAALKTFNKTVTGCIFYHTNKNITNEKNFSMLFLKTFKDAKFAVDVNAFPIGKHVFRTPDKFSSVYVL